MKIRPVGAELFHAGGQKNRRIYGGTDGPTWRSKWSLFV